MYKHVFTTGERLFEEAAAVFGIHSEPQPQMKLIALNTEQWERTEVIALPRTTFEKRRADTVYELVSASGPGIAQVLKHSASDGASGTSPFLPPLCIRTDMKKFLRFDPVYFCSKIRNCKLPSLEDM